MKWFVVVVLALCAFAHVDALTKRQQKKLAVRTGQTRWNWNHKTAAEGFGPILGKDLHAPRTDWAGKLYTTYPAGHNFATRRAVDFVHDNAAKDGSLAANALKVFHVKDLAALYEDKEKTCDAVHELLMGNFQNELRVNLDGDADIGYSAKTAAGAKLIRAAFAKDKEITADGVNSVHFNKATGYYSANFIHSMLVTDGGKTPATYTQEKSYHAMTSFALEQLTAAVNHLRGDDKAWELGWREVGRVLHLLQDSAVGCTVRHMQLGNKGTASENTAATCIPGDGHSVLVYDAKAKRTVVTGMSDTHFYDGRTDVHAALDDLYDPAHVLPMKDLVDSKDHETLHKKYLAAGAKIVVGDEDPAYDGGRMLIELVNGVPDKNIAAAQLASDLVFRYIFPRYVAAKALVMPTIEESKKLREKLVVGKQG